MFRNANDFGMLFLYLTTLLNSRILIVYLYVCLGFYMYNHSILVRNNGFRVRLT